MFTQTEQVAIRKYCGYGAMTAIAFNSQGGMGKLNILIGGLAAEEEAEIQAQLVNLKILEDAVMLASDNLDTVSAGPLVLNRNEVADRKGLFNNYRMRLCEFLGMEPGPGLTGGGARVVRC
jgi:hypothetical protein